MRGSSVTWPLVGLVGLALGFVLAVMLVIPEDDVQTRSSLIGLVILAGNGALALFMRSKIDEGIGDVRKQVNGRMSQLLDNLAHVTADLEAERARNVSRETEGGHRGDHRPEGLGGAAR